MSAEAAIPAAYRRDLVRSSAQSRARRLAPPDRPVTAPRPDAHEAFVQLEREIGLLLRRSRAISARLAGVLHPDLDGADYGLLALLEDTGPLRQ